MQGPSMQPAPLTNSNPQSAVCHTCMLQCSCACFIQACHVQTCMIGVFFSPCTTRLDIFIFGPPIAYQSLLISAVRHKCSSHYLQAHAVREVYICSSIHHSWPQGATYYSESTAVIKSQTSADKNQRRSCKSLKVVALKGRGLGRHLLCSCWSHAS